MRKLATLVLGLIVFAWIGYTLQAVARFGGAVVLDPDATARIMSVRNGLELHTAPGLTYHGYAGAALAIFEVVVVLVGVVLAFLARGWPRAAGLLVLLAWTGLWLGDIVWLRQHGYDRTLDVIGIAAALGVTLLWSGLRLTTPSRGGRRSRA